MNPIYLVRATCEVCRKPYLASASDIRPPENARDEMIRYVCVPCFEAESASDDSQWGA